MDNFASLRAEDIQAWLFWLSEVYGLKRNFLIKTPVGKGSRPRRPESFSIRFDSFCGPDRIQEWIHRVFEEHECNINWNKGTKFAKMTIREVSGTG